MKRLLVSFCLVASCLIACSGGGGGGGSTPPAAAVKPTPTPASVSGDMLAYAPSRGWNYQGQAEGDAATISLYAEPTLIDGYEAFVIGINSGTVPTLLTSESAFYEVSDADMGVTEGATGYTVGIEASSGGAYAVPSPLLLVESTLTLGQSWSPYPGATATVTAVGTVPGAGACPTPAAGATVAYVYTSPTGAEYGASVSYVPGCGITALSNPNESFTLVSTAIYTSIGQTSIARRLEGLTFFDTIKSLLGMNRHAFPGSAHHVTDGFFLH